MVTTSPQELGDALLGRTRGAVLGLLMSRPGEEFHVRQIVRLSGAGLGPVHRELNVLARLGVLVRRQVGHQVMYRSNLACPIYEELRGLVLKSIGAAGMIAHALAPLSDKILAAFLFGSLAGGQEHPSSDVDLMVVGDVSFAAVVRAIADSQRRLGRDVNPTVYPPTEFAAKLRTRHHFLTAVKNGPKLFLVGGEDELARVAEERLAPPTRHHGSRSRGASGRHRAGSVRKR